MSATDEPQQSSETGADSNKEFLQYIRERDQARELAAEKEKECNAAKSRSYELMKKVEELEEQVKELKKNKSNKQNGGGAKKQAASKPTNQNKSQAVTNKTITRAEKASKNPKKGTTHPIIPGKESLAEDTLAFFTYIAERCPDLKLSVVRRTEKLFIEGDINGDGLIDVDELDTLFTKHFALYTRKQVEEILHSVDADGSMTLDFIEVLNVVQQVDSGEKTNLPHGSVQKSSKGTAICSIQ